MQGTGALDSQIKQAVTNDIAGFLEAHPSIKKVILNGREAESAFTIPFAHEYVDSSSPANAKSLDNKIAEWISKLTIVIPFGLDFPSRAHIYIYYVRHVFHGRKFEKSRCMN